MAELKLDVTLNLAGFRAQLNKLTAEAGAHYFGVKLSIDSTDFRKQLKNLEKIKPVITINDSQLVAARERIGILNKSLATLRRATATPIEIKVKYVEVGKSPSGGTAEIGRAVSGGVRGSQALEGLSRSQLQSARKAMVLAGMSVGEIGNLAKASTDEYKKSIIQGFTNSGQEAINGFAAGLKDSSSKIGQVAAKVGEKGVRGIKDALGIASPSKVFRQIGEFSVDGLELGFLNGLKDFKNKSISEVRKIVALLKLEFAKIKDISGAGVGPSTGRLRQQLLGNRAYTAPIGPLPMESKAPWAKGDRGKFGYSGYEPRMVSRVRGEPIAAAPNSFLQFSRDAAQIQPSLGTPGNFRGFSQRATQIQQASGGMPVSGGGTAGGGGGGGVPPRGGGAFGGMQFAMPKLPASGVVEALGTEFAFATKQVLLFGSAYKALAFLTDFPSKVGEAVGQLQTFRNTLKAISPSAQEAGQSSQFILDVVDKYNIPLQSARDGFTKLYASMQPAGFGGNEIRDLFLGISQAAATFGMSADKVDRVNYAFAQMASKGQIMSEELKGQLGDVLPGAMAIFAEAAGFKGPEAITKFSKALEDGAYKGEAMKTLLTNVGIGMREEFGPGAEGAAKTFQGSINRMQNSLKLFYEAFEPVAVGFLNAVVMPMTSGIKTLTDGFNAFFTGQAAQTAGGNAFAQQLNNLKPSFEGIRNNIAQILPLLQSFGKIALSLGSILLQIAGNPFVGYLARVYLAVLPLTIAIQALNLSALIPLIRNLLAAVPAFVAFTASQLRGMSTLGSFKAATYGLGLTAAATGVKIRLLSGIIKTAFATTVIGVALLGLGMLIEKLMMAGIKADDAKQKMLQFADSVKQAGKASDVSGLTTTLAEEKVMAKRIKNAKALLEEIKKGKKSISKQQKEELDALGLTSNMGFFQEGGPGNLSQNLTVQVSMVGVLDANIQAAQKGYLETQTRIVQSQKALNEAKTKQVKDEEEIKKIKLEGEDDGKAAEREARERDKLANRQDQLAQEAANRQVALDQSSFESRLRMSDAEYDHKRALQDSYFEREISGLDSIEARQKKFQQDLKAIENRRIDSIRKAELDAVKAVQDLRSATVKAAAVSGAPGSAKFGDTGRTFNAPGFVHGHVQNMDRGALKSDSIALVKSLLQQGVTPELSSGAKFNRSMSDGQIADLVGRGIAAHKQYASGAGAIDIFVPKGTFVPVPLSNVGNLGGAAGVTGTMQGGSQLMHLDPSSKSSSVGPATRPGAFAMQRRGDKVEGQLAVEQQNAQNRAAEKLLTIRNANNLALQQTITLVQQNIDSIFPVKEQKLENDLLEMRNNLELKGASKEIVDMEVQKYKAVKENAYNLQILNEKIAKNNEELTKLKGKKITTVEDREQIKFLTEQTAAYNLAIAGIPENQRLFNEQLERTAALAIESPMVKLAKQVNEAKRELMEMSSASSMAIGGAKSIGEAFGSSFKDMINGSKTVKESMASLFQSVGNYFLDMGSRIISKWIEIQAIQGLMSIFNMFAPRAAAGEGFALGGPGGQGAAGSYGGAMSATSSLPSFTGGAGFQPVSMGGFGVQRFADGGMVTGPTLGLVGEGRYNEAIIPLPNGKSVPVELGDAAATNNINSNIVVNVNSDGQSSSNINGSNSVDLGRKIEGAVKQVIVTELRPGGILAGRR